MRVWLEKVYERRRVKYLDDILLLNSLISERRVDAKKWESDVIEANISGQVDALRKSFWAMERVDRLRKVWDKIFGFLVNKKGGING